MFGVSGETFSSLFVYLYRKTENRKLQNQYALEQRVVLDMKKKECGLPVLAATLDSFQEMFMVPQVSVTVAYKDPVCTTSWCVQYTYHPFLFQVRFYCSSM